MDENKKSRLLTISEFSRISEISRKALIFYDNTGVFSPKYTAPNGYRYYAHEQIYIISVINILKELGMPLSQVRQYTSDITPENAIALLKEQGVHLSRKIKELQSVRDMLNIKLQKLEEGCGEDMGAVQITHFDETPVFISNDFRADRAHIPDDIWLDFYMKCKKKQISFGYPEGYLVPKDSLIKKQTKEVSNIIAYVNDARYANRILPAGQYITAYGQGGLEDTAAVYSRIFNFIEENHSQIIGGACEERLIDEVGSSEKEGQIIRIRIRIRSSI